MVKKLNKHRDGYTVSGIVCSVDSRKAIGSRKGSPDRLAFFIFMKKSLKIIIALALIIFLAYTLNFYLNNSNFLQTKIQNFTSSTLSPKDHPPATSTEKKYLVIESHVPVMFPGDSPITKTEQTLPDDVQKVPIEKITNVGYTFYLGKIDHPGNTQISDEVKTQVTKIITNAYFPQYLLNNLSIIFVNTLAANPTMYVETPKGWIKLEGFNKEFLNEGGNFTSYYNNEAQIIFINQSNVGIADSLEEILTHELGHDIGSQLTDDQWRQYYQLRDIPKDTPRIGNNWYTSVSEDFAEVYKYLFTGKNVRTAYGFLKATNYNFELAGTCGKIHDQFLKDYINQRGIEIGSTDYFNKITDLQKTAENLVEKSTVLQNCRRDVLLHRDKYPNDWEYSIPYVSIVSDPTKNFITKITNDLNH